jgi:hypothetical protein
MKLFYVTALMILATFSCSSIQEISSKKGNEVILASSGVSCKVVGEHSRWKIGYGSFPLYMPDSKELFPKSSKAYRVKESSKWYDVAISVVLGFSTTISKDTLVVEECPLPGGVEKKIAKSLDSENEIFQKMIQESVEKYLAEKEKEYESVLDATLSQNEEKLQIRKNIPTIWLKSGKIIQGKILNQDSDKVEIETIDGNKKSINKDLILKIRMR